jgi:hypothetical protein
MAKLIDLVGLGGYDELGNGGNRLDADERGVGGSSRAQSWDRVRDGLGGRVGEVVGAMGMALGKVVGNVRGEVARSGVVD